MKGTLSRLDKFSKVYKDKKHWLNVFKKHKTTKNKIELKNSGPCHVDRTILEAESLEQTTYSF